MTNTALGEYLNLYFRAFYLREALSLSESDGSSADLAEGLIPLADILLQIYVSLPKEYDIKSIDELEFVLADFANATLADSPSEFEKGFLETVTLSPYVFTVPVARTGDLNIECSFGGRHRLQLMTSDVDGYNILMLTGLIESVHWTGAKRTATVLSEELTGCLIALGVAEVASCPHPKSNLSSPPPLEILLASPNIGCDGIWKDGLILSWQQIQDIWRTTVVPSRLLTDIEKKQTKKAGPAAVIDSRLGLVKSIVDKGGPYAGRLLTAARFLKKATTADSFGDAFLYMATCLEGILVDGKNELSSRVSDAVAFLLGESHDDRMRLRGLTKTLYDVRSRYIHDGEYVGTEPDRLKCLELTKKVVGSELRRFRPC